MKNKLVALVLLVVVVFSLTACGEKAPKPENSVFYQFNSAYSEEDYIKLLGEPDEIIENYNDNSSLKRYVYNVKEFNGVEGKLQLEFYRFNYVFSLRQAIFTVFGSTYEDKKQYSKDMESLIAFLDEIYECKDGIGQPTWYNNYKDETVMLAQSDTAFGFIYKHED